MQAFMDEQFLLSTETAKHLYHDYAKDMPIYDYHCHVNPAEITENKSYDNITQLWLYGDHYKWRAMRAFGIPEELCTGPADDYARFLAFCKMLPTAIGNPLYHWSHLELRRFFNVYEIINEKNAPIIWEKVNAQLGSNGLRCRDFIINSNVRLICTTDDPTDTLDHHKQLAAENLPFKVLPAFRPDKAMDMQKDWFVGYIKKLGDTVGYELTTVDKLKSALANRIEYFHENGCRVSDHGMEGVSYAIATDDQINAIYQKALKGEAISNLENDQFRTLLFAFIGEEYAKHGWVMQLHIGAMRNNNTRKFIKLGADTGFDSMSDLEIANPLSRMLDSMERMGCLPKTILYTLNPKDNYVLASMLGNFQGDVPGKIQFGSGWWFNDQKTGMIDQMTTLANVGLLGEFLGMLTDSRSYLSYTRHEYFRRILCNLIGNWVENGEYPLDESALKEIVQGISYNNAKVYFGIEL